ncbi:thiamine pyrophosphate-dependent enzyme [Chloroflexota bacterium]
MVTETKIHPLVEQYFRVDRMPHLACPGCGIGMVMKYTLQAVDELGIDPQKFAWLTGVGCSSRLPYAVWKGDCIDATHGRPLAMATGLKLSRPDLNVLVYTGDGDCLSIGGNHFIHACRRNVPVTVVMFNNQIYGMTGGQIAPTTPLGYETQTSPYGGIEEPFDGAKLAATAGATYSCRWTAFQPKRITDSIKKGLSSNGFSYIEVFSPCPTQFGRYALKIGDPVQLAQWTQKHTIDIKKAESMTREELADKIVVGVYADIERPSLVERYSELCKKVQGAGI